MSRRPWPPMAAVAAVLVLASTVACTDGGDVVRAPVTTTTSTTYATAEGATRYVSPSGDDGAEGTASQPWRTLRRSLQALRPGDHLYVGGGVYRERVTDARLRPGEPDARVLVSAVPGERPVVQGLLWLRQPSYWTFDGIDVTWDDATGERDEHLVKITDGEGWTWTNSEIWGARSFAGMLVAGDLPGEPAHWTVTRTCIHDTVPSNGANEDHNLYIGDMDDAGPGVVERNVFFNAPNGHNVKLGGADPSGGPTDVVVRYNTLNGASVPVTVAGAASDVVVERNILGTAERGYLVRGYQLSGDGNEVRDNLGFGADRFFADDSDELDAGRNVFADPVFAGAGRCDGFHPTAGDADRYGRWGGGP